MGGTLIRSVIQHFQHYGMALPLTGPVLIACSGGVDSVALAHLISRYGRKIVAPDQISLLHFDHGWRKESGTLEKKGVRALAKDLGVGFISKKLVPPGPGNFEEDARLKRNSVYQELAGPELNFKYVLTAHHQDDVVETLIWRFFRGEFLENRHGIMFYDAPVLRPFLKVTKERLRLYAAQEKLPYFEDPTNQDPHQMRSQLRQKVIPLLGELFPGFVRSLSRYTEVLPSEQEVTGSDLPKLEAFQFAVDQLLVRSGAASRLNRAQKQQIQNLMKTVKVGKKVSLPGGVTLEQLGERSFKLFLAKDE